jgi:hypothetical protein
MKACQTLIPLGELKTGKITVDVLEFLDLCYIFLNCPTPCCAFSVHLFTKSSKLNISMFFGWLLTPFSGQLDQHEQVHTWSDIRPDY